LERINGALERSRYATERHEDYAEALVVVVAIIDYCEAKDSMIAPVDKGVDQSISRSRRWLGD
jgi:hypothetical protein